jgi:cobalt-zinc-cadmium efflux system membrane fusion protein
MRGARARHGAASLAAIAALAGACAAPAGDMPPDDRHTAAGVVRVPDRAAAAAGIETAAVRTVERTEALQAAGVVTFDERRTARIGALVDGVVADIHVQPGDAVAARAVVARLHSHVVHDAWAGYFQALAARRRAEAEVTYARTAEARAARLVADRALSPQELERARADLNAAEQGLASVLADLTRSEQELEHYGIVARPDAKPLEESDVPVFAPFGGTVIERQATQGAAVTLGTPLLVISDLTRLWVTAEIDETAVGRVAAGQPVTLTTAAYPGEVFTGTLAAVGDVINPTTRRVTIRIEVGNAERRLRPQMFVTVRVGAAAPRRVLVVPARAVQTAEGESLVFVREGGERYVRRTVVAGPEADGLVEIVRGLSEGETVVTAGAFLLKSELVKPAAGDP